MPKTGRHAAPRVPARRRALLPTVLLLTAGGAFAGLAAVPTPADAGSPTETASVSAAPPQALRLSAARAGDRLRDEAATEAAEVRRMQERASRSRNRPPAAPAAAPAATRAVAPPPAPPAPAPAPAAAAPKPKPKPAAASHVRPGRGRLTSHYGPRWGRLHAGIDLAAGTGSPVRSVAAGTVASARDEGGYGLCARVQHPDGTVTLYAHLSKLLVGPGQPVAAGAPLGLEGSTGHSTGPHLHFEVRIGGRPVDPIPWLRARGVDPARG